MYPLIKKYLKTGRTTGRITCAILFFHQELEHDKATLSNSCSWLNFWSFNFIDIFHKFLNADLVLVRNSAFSSKFEFKTGLSMC